MGVMPKIPGIDFIGGKGKGGSNGIETIVPGEGIEVDDTDPKNPVVSAPGGSSDDALKLDQVTPQRVINGAPVFSKGIIIVAGEKIIFDGE